jgi:hypothetical protein
MNTLRSQPAIHIEDFLSDVDIIELVSRGEAKRDGCILRLSDRRVFVLQEAVRVLGTVSHETDPYGFCGTTDTIGALLKRGFMMSANRIALGRAVYDAEYGYLVQEVGFGNPDASGVSPAQP